jgi:hypothetical protein
MEGVGLLAGDDPIRCIGKGIPNFTNKDRDVVIERDRLDACRNAAEFALPAPTNDAGG